MAADEPSLAFNVGGDLDCNRRHHDETNCMGAHYAERGWAFSRDVQFKTRFSSRVNLRCALLVPRSEAVPKPILAALRQHRCKHVLNESRRCVAFSLGVARQEPTGLVWYVLALQSDLAFCKSARLRDYVRGWRKYLFAAILDAAKEAAVSAIAMPAADNVAKAATWWIARNVAEAPPSWRAIYDRTSAEFGLAPRTIREPIDLQLLPRKQPFLCKEFFVRELIK